jgi:uncharacterized coiled-coil protein SlyX
MTGFVLTLKPDAEMAALLRDIINRLAILEKLMSATDEKIAALLQTVTDQGTVIESAIALLNGLTTALAEAKDDPAQIQAIIDQVAAQKDALAGAVVANTPPVA